jgi:hypothetical protein
MPNRRLDGVFVSSVYDERQDYRKAALDGVLRARLHPVGMERENIAKPGTTLASSRAMVEESSIYVGIFAQRYGKLTIEELRYAEFLGLPILAFFAEQRLNDSDVESDPTRVEQLAAIKQELRDKRTVATFRTAEELGIKVLQSLLDLIRQGKVAATESSLASVEKLPRPPKPYYAHPYIGSSRFVGRKRELGLLEPQLPQYDPASSQSRMRQRFALSSRTRSASSIKAPFQPLMPQQRGSAPGGRFGPRTNANRGGRWRSSRIKRKSWSYWYGAV